VDNGLKESDLVRIYVGGLHKSVNNFLEGKIYMNDLKELVPTNFCASSRGKTDCTSVIQTNWAQKVFRWQIEFSKKC